MNKVIELENGKFGIKVLDESGNTIRVCEEQFVTIEEAEAFANASGTTNATPEADAPTADTAENVPEDTNEPEPTVDENETLE